MKTFYLHLLLLALIGLTGCVSPARVDYDSASVGKIRSYKIVDVQGGGNHAVRFPDEFTGRSRTIDLKGRYSGVLVGVSINNRAEPEYIWVEKKDLSLAFPPF